MTGSKNSKTKKTNSSKAKKPPKVDQSTTKYTNEGIKREISGVICIVISVFIFVAVYFNAAGIIGEFSSTFLKSMLGHIAYIIPFILLVAGGFCFVKTDQKFTIVSVMLISIIILMCATVNSVRFLDDQALSYEVINEFYVLGAELKSGGFFGMIISTVLKKFAGVVVIYILGIATIIICCMILFNTTLSHGFLTIKRRADERKSQVSIKREEKHLSQLRIQEEERDVSPADEDSKEYKGKERIIDEKDYLYDQKLEEMRKRADRKKVGALFGFMKKKNDTDENESFVGVSDSEPSDSVGREQDVINDAPVVTYGLVPSVNPSNSLNSDGDITYGLNFGEEKRASKPQQLESSIANISTYDSIPEVSVENPYTNNTFLNNDYNATFSNDNRTPLNNDRSTSLSSDYNNSRSNDFSLEKPNNKKQSKYVFPSIEFLKKAAIDTKSLSNSELKSKAAKLEETLRSFKVDASVVGVTQGPAVTRYEIQPNIGVRVNSIVRLADDIALSLEAKNIRIEAPIPGKAVVGIEVENGNVNTVFLREIIGSKEFKSSKSKITFAIGKDISGKPIIADLKSMPHMLIAGATGSGKSVCINSIIASLLYKSTPEEVKVVLIDPKVVELGNYNGIPHLLIPVVTEPPKAAAALNWAVAEMNDRYKKFAEVGVRDLESYNEFVGLNSNTSADAYSRNKNSVIGLDDNSENSYVEERIKLPQIVIIIDELADLMMAAPTQVEESICRLAQMARAAGMHLIVATQRPSVDIITGVIKANIPSRIAFAVSSQFDSRTILDMNGAEKLVGKGDMLFSPVGTGKPIRVQGTFISDSEVNKIIEHVKSQVQAPEYSGEVINSLERLSSPQAVSEDTDDLLNDAIETIVRANQASISMIQRRFRIGYNRAARIIDMIESRGIIGPPDGAKPRQVLMSIEQYEAMKGEQ